MIRSVAILFIAILLLCKKSQGLPPLEEICCKPSIACRLFAVVGDEVAESEMAESCAKPDAVASPAQTSDALGGEVAPSPFGDLGSCYKGVITRVPQFRIGQLLDDGVEHLKEHPEITSAKFIMLNLDAGLKPAYFSSVKMLGIQHLKEENLEYFAAVLKEAQNLQCLSLDGFDLQSTMDEALSIIGKQCQTLVSLTVSGWIPGRSGLLNNWPAVKTLQHLAMEKIALPHSAVTMSLAEAYPLLRSLTVDQCFYSQENGLKLAKNISQLQFLERLEARGLRDLSMLSLIGELKNLQYLLFADMDLAEFLGSRETEISSSISLATEKRLSRNIIVTVENLELSPCFYKFLGRLRFSVLDISAVDYLDDASEGVDIDIDFLLEVARSQKAIVIASGSLEDEIRGMAPDAGKNMIFVD